MMRTPEELFLDAINAYKEWLEVGKDFLNHSDLFEIWDSAITAYAQSVFITRNRAVSHVLQGLEVMN